MRARGDSNPGSYSISQQPKKPGYVLVRFFENARQATGEDASGWEYDEYHLELPESEGTADAINASDGSYREQARRADTELSAMLTCYTASGWISAEDVTEAYRSGLVLLLRKKIKIEQSKAELEVYLKEHPLQWTDGEYYSITAAKQQQLAGKIMTATMAQSIGADYTLKWNSTGDICKEWTLTELSTLGFAIDARVTALVTYQQTQEAAIQDALTLEALDAIEVDYDSVQ